MSEESLQNLLQKLNHERTMSDLYYQQVKAAEGHSDLNRIMAAMRERTYGLYPYIIDNSDEHERSSPTVIKKLINAYRLRTDENERHYLRCYRVMQNRSANKLVGRGNFRALTLTQRQRINRQNFDEYKLILNNIEPLVRKNKDGRANFVHDIASKIYRFNSDGKKNPPVLFTPDQAAPREIQES